MQDFFLPALIVLAIANLFELAIVYFRWDNRDSSQSESAVREEFRSSREESRGVATELRTAIMQSMTTFADTNINFIRELGTQQGKQLHDVQMQVSNLVTVSRRDGEELRESINKKLTALEETNERKHNELRQTVEEKLSTSSEQLSQNTHQLRNEIGNNLKLVSETNIQTLAEMSKQQGINLEAIG